VPIDRTTITAWEDGRVVDWVRATGKKTLVFAGLWAEVCLVFPVIHALGDGYEVYFVTDASGGTSQEAHEMGIARMIQAAAVPLTTVVFMSELQRDWARTDQAAKLSEIILEHGGATATRSPGNGSCSPVRRRLSYAAGAAARVPHYASWAAADGVTAGVSLQRALVFEPLAA
jgi:hypothetical protein